MTKELQDLLDTMSATAMRRHDLQMDLEEADRLEAHWRSEAARLRRLLGEQPTAPPSAPADPAPPAPDAP